MRTTTDLESADQTHRPNQSADLFVDSWGAGTPVVLVHGSLATGAEEWDTQRPLADEGFRLLVPDRRGYVRSAGADGEDFLRDGDDIAELMGVGSDPDEFPAEFLAAARPLVPLLRRGRPFWQAELPLADLAAAPYPKLLVSGGHSAGFEALCDELADRIGARRTVVAGAGHEIQFTGAPINDALCALWHRA